MAKKEHKKYYEYAIQALLIVFSVLLALFLDEYRSHMKNNKELEKILYNTKQELYENKMINDELISYHEIVTKNIEDASNSDSAFNSLKSDFGFKLYAIAPYGIMQKSISNSVWQTAKLNPLLSQIEFNKLQLIGSAYKQQEVVIEEADIIKEILRSREMLSNKETFENLLLLYNEINELREKEIELSRIYEKVLKELE